MQESSFVSTFEAAAIEVMGSKAVVVRKANLFYQLSLDRRLQLSVGDTRLPARGSSAFQTDLCICELINGLQFPRVVVEFKTKITSHDVITYSAKAGKHKAIYPCLRYGLLASEEPHIPGKFFVHNESMDFFIAAKNYMSEEQLKPFAKKLIEKELEASRILEQIHFDGRQFDYYCTDVVFRNFQETL